MRELYSETEYWKELGQLGKWRRPAFGWDIAVTGDLACIWLNERIDPDLFRLAACITFRGCKTESQRRVVEAILNAFPDAVGAGDASGLGTTECANLEVLYYGRFQGIKFNVQSKLVIYTNAQGIYEARRQELPVDYPEIAADIAAMRKTASAAEKLLFTASRNELLPESHCDLMTANALALLAGETINNNGPARFEAADAPEEAWERNSWERSRYPDHSGDK